MTRLGKEKALFLHFNRAAYRLNSKKLKTAQKKIFRHPSKPKHSNLCLPHLTQIRRASIKNIKHPTRTYELKVFYYFLNQGLVQRY